MATIAIASGIFTMTFGLILTRPKHVNEGAAGIIGALLMLVFGLVSFTDIKGVLHETGSLIIMLFAMMIISIVIDESGFFHWAAGKAVKKANGNGRKLFFNTFLMGTIITTLISNDATALIITPIVYHYVVALRLNPLPFMLACTFVADTASLSLPVSNLTNLLVYQQMDMTFIPYVLTMVFPTLVAVCINYIVFYVLFRHSIPKNYDGSGYVEADYAVHNKAFFTFSTALLIIITFSYVIGSFFNIPIVGISVLGALALLMGARFLGGLSEKAILSQVSFSVLFFVIGMFIVVKGLQNTGLTHIFSNWLMSLSDGSLFKAILFTSFGTALGSNLINNVPMDLLMVTTLKAIPQGPLSLPMGYATILGAGLGPNLTIVGSLATMLWVATLKRKNIHITPLQYLKYGILTAPIMILGASLALYVTLTLRP